jgi:hypothetical protein
MPGGSGHLPAVGPPIKSGDDRRGRGKRRLCRRCEPCRTGRANRTAVGLHPAMTKREKARQQDDGRMAPSHQVGFWFMTPCVAKVAAFPIAPELLALSGTSLDLNSRPNARREAIADHFAPPWRGMAVARPALHRPGNHADRGRLGGLARGEKSLPAGGADSGAAPGWPGSGRGARGRRWHGVRLLARPGRASSARLGDARRRNTCASSATFHAARNDRPIRQPERMAAS